MTCAACQSNINKNVGKIDGVYSVNVNLLSNSMTVEYDEKIVNSDDIINAVQAIGYGASLYDFNSKNNSFKSKWDKRKIDALNAEKNLKQRVILSFLFLIPLMYISMGHMIGLPFPYILNDDRYLLILAITQMLISIPILFINRKFFVSGFKGIFNRAPNMDSLVAMGSTASFVFSLVSLYLMSYNALNGRFDAAKSFYHNLYFESSAMILALVTLGKYFESRSKRKTSFSLDKLIDLSPKTAIILDNGKERIINTEDISVGDIVVIRPGDIIPVDGVLVEGVGFVDQSAVTGESLPVERLVNDSVICATKNVNGYFKFKATKVGEDTTLSQIINLVDEAGSSKAKIARIADKVSGVFVPIVIIVAAITAAIWLLIGKGIETALVHAVSVLVISCPCALGLATPVAIMVGTGKAANLGILVRSAEVLEKLYSVDTVVFDKTGTLTEGKPIVSDFIVLSDENNREDVLKIAASLENGSNHPYALAIIEEYKKYGKELYNIENFSNISGRGISAKINDNVYFIGNVSFMKESNVPLDDSVYEYIDMLSSKGKTSLLFAKNDNLFAVFGLTDEIRSSSKDAIKALHKLNIKTVMLTGDNKIVANNVRDNLLIDEVFSEVMPADKDAYIKKAQANGKCVAMVGDGINDAPALARSDVGIAIGVGTDIAVETADIVLMKNSIFDVVSAVMLSRSIIKNIKTNLFWAFFYNIIGIPIAAGVLSFVGVNLSPMIAAAAMSFSSFFVVTNALRLYKFKPCEIYKTEENVMKKVIKISGMMCGHCTARVEKALLETDGVKNVVMSLEDGTATVETELDSAVLIKVVENAGYSVIECK